MLAPLSELPVVTAVGIAERRTGADRRLAVVAQPAGPQLGRARRLSRGCNCSLSVELLAFGREVGDVGHVSVQASEQVGRVGDDVVERLAGFCALGGSERVAGLHAAERGAELDGR